MCITTSKLFNQFLKFANWKYNMIYVAFEIIWEQKFFIKVNPPPLIEVKHNLGKPLMILLPTFAIKQKRSVKSVRSYMHPLKQ